MLHICMVLLVLHVDHVFDYCFYHVYVKHFEFPLCMKCAFISKLALQMSFLISNVFVLVIKVS